MKGVIVAPHQFVVGHTPQGRAGPQLEPGLGLGGGSRADNGKGTPGWLNNFATSGNRTFHAPAKLDTRHQQHQRTTVACPDCPLSTCSSRCIQGHHGLCASPPSQARRSSASCLRSP